MTLLISHNRDNKSQNNLLENYLKIIIKDITYIYCMNNLRHTLHSFKYKKQLRFKKFYFEKIGKHSPYLLLFNLSLLV